MGLKGPVCVRLWRGVLVNMVSSPSHPGRGSLLPRVVLLHGATGLHMGAGARKCRPGEGASSHRRTFLALPSFPGLPSLLSADLEMRRRLQELQPSDAGEMEEGGMAPPAHGSVWPWLWVNPGVHSGSSRCQL